MTSPQSTARLLAAALALAVAGLASLPGAAPAATLPLEDGRISYNVDIALLGKAYEGWLDKQHIRASLDFDAAQPSASKFNVVLDATKFASGNELRDAHQQEQIGGATYPTVKFMVGSMVQQGPAVQEGANQRLKVLAYGKMQWHGVLKDVGWPVDVVVSPDRVTVDAAFTLNIKDYGMEPERLLGVPVKETVPVKVHLVFKR